jgi:hypothetical protein
MTGDPSNTENAKSQGRGRSNSLPGNVVGYLKAWLMSSDHINHPYPTEKEKAQMVADTGIELKRLNNWFVNNRIRYWKPRMEALQRQHQPNKDTVRTEANKIAPASLVSQSPRVDVGAPNWFEQVAKMLPELQSPSHQTLAPCSPSSAHAVSDASTSANDSSTSSDDGDVSDDSSVVNYSGKTRVKEAVLHESKSSTNNASTRSIRKRHPNEDILPYPRSKFSRKNVDLWRAACKTTARLNDKNLPTFDEAACLFGYASDQ